MSGIVRILTNRGLVRSGFNSTTTQRFSRNNFPLGRGLDTTSRANVFRLGPQRQQQQRFASAQSLGVPPKANHFPWGIVGGLASATLAGSVYLYHQQQQQQGIVSAEAEQRRLAEEKLKQLDVQDFVHPYDSRDWYWQLFFKTKRFIFLFAVFLPCVTVASIATVTGNERVRAYGLDLLVDALNASGCGLQKFGQWLSMRPDILPPDVIAALSSLRQDVPAHDIKHTRAMVKESFGSEVDEVFEIFDDKPVASGSVAQVYRGRLREDYALKANIRDEDGNLIRDVAVKVRHPNVLAETWCDIELIYSFIRFTDILTVPFKKDEFLISIQRQINFKAEAQNLVRFAENFEKEVKSGLLKFPTVSVNMISPSILIESWAGGNTISDIFSNVGDGFQVIEKEIQAVGQKTKKAIAAVDDFVTEEVLQKKRELASTLFDMSIKMFLRDNLVHGDLHAGNVLYDKNGNCCTVLDAGLTASIEEPVRKEFGQFLHALCTGDVDQLVGKVMDFHVEVDDDNLNAARVKARGLDSKDSEAKAEAISKLHQDMKQEVGLWVDPSGRTAPDGGPISLGDLVGGMLFALQRHGVCLRADVATSLMTMSLTEGLIRSLDPEFDMVKQALPYFVRFNDAW